MSADQSCATCQHRRYNPDGDFAYCSQMRSPAHGGVIASHVSDLTGLGQTAMRNHFDTLGVLCRVYQRENCEGPH